MFDFKKIRCVRTLTPPVSSGRAYPTEIMLTHPMGGYPCAGDVAKPPVEAQFAPVGVYQVPP